MVSILVCAKIPIGIRVESRKREKNFFMGKRIMNIGK